ncbi:sugar ABC transporter ATP-binding protein [Variovorax sp. PBL-E5]|uniref:sugar ABC transporter ATP-binding protein n=1 Tax=Variovorax sp. PBL-E5 TaxID=434014 RepID=UPI001318A02D|nr:sugar ABC transporter ATP-binding protein [Variovorax sp. PBL-E5]VTU38204.1 Ribose import ATP-binding protein RbsA [Variovorax sp. PBL-E5]
MNDCSLKIANVSKAYGAVRALQDVSFSVRRGTIHAVLGENGAGKSTLMKVIKGEVAPDRGSIELDGQAYARYEPAYTRGLGVIMVHQELAVFDNLSVAENIFPDLGRFRRGGAIDAGRLRAEARRALASFDFDLHPDTLLSQLTLGQKQLIEILRALNQPRRLLILDEPTSGLSTAEADRLMRLLRKLADGGETILFISHRIPEILGACDEVSVLRDGRYIETFDCRRATEAELVNRMAGRELARDSALRAVRPAGGEPLLQASGLRVPGRLDDLSLRLHAGEVVGLFGLEGSGSSEVAPALFGLHVAKGEVQVRGQRVPHLLPHELRRRGVGFVNTNRKEAGLFMRSSIAANISSPVLARFSGPAGWLRRQEATAFARDYMQRFSIKAASADAPPADLSGGNQQKVMLAAALADDPQVVLINEPTRGVDVGAKADIHRHLRGLAEAGKSLLVMSSELPELLSLCDRILVMRSRRIVGECGPGEMDPEAIMTLAAGHAPASPATGVPA